MSKFTRALSSYCHSRGMTLAELSRKSKVSYVYMFNKKGLSIKQFNTICQYLKLDIFERDHLSTLVVLRRPRDTVVVDDAFVQTVNYILVKNGKNWCDLVDVCATVLRCAGVRVVIK